MYKINPIISNVVNIHFYFFIKFAGGESLVFNKGILILISKEAVINAHFVVRNRILFILYYCFKSEI